MLDGVIFEDEGRKPDGTVQPGEREQLKSVAEFIFADGAAVRPVTRKLPPLAKYPEIVMSVPHSGTRTLVEAIGIEGFNAGLPGGRWWHFGSHLDYVRQFIDKDLLLHIPVRNPMNVAKSWATRATAARRLLSLLTAYGQMFEVIAMLPPERAYIYKMEAVPRDAWRGTDDKHKELHNKERVEVFQDVIMTNIVKPHRWFFEYYYPEIF